MGCEAVLEGNSLRVSRVFFHLAFAGDGAVTREWGNTLRGGFGHALRAVSCSLRRDSCAECPLGRACAYGYLFETPIQKSDTVMRKYTSAPHPFVLEPDTLQRPVVSAGDRIVFSMVLAGQAASYLPYILLALRELGGMGLGRDRVHFDIIDVTDENGAVCLGEESGNTLRPIAEKALTLAPGVSRQAEFTIHFQSPARIQHGGRILERPGLPELVESLRRRLFLMCCFHGNGAVQPLSQEYISAAAAAETLRSEFAWRDAGRHSTRQMREVPIGGAVGRIRCRGDLGVLNPLLRAGEYVHVGKNAAFGLGKISLEVHAE